MKMGDVTEGEMKGKRDLEGRGKVEKMIWKPLGVICRSKREKLKKEIEIIVCFLLGDTPASVG